MTRAAARRSWIPAAVVWGAVFGVVMAASPLAFWWLDPSTVYALGLVLIASVYVGFAVADGRPKVIVVESSVASVRRQFVANTRWWPPFCVVTDWVAAAIIAT